MRSFALSILAILPLLAAPVAGLTIDLDGREIVAARAEAKHVAPRAGSAHRDVRRSRQCKTRHSSSAPASSAAGAPTDAPSSDSGAPWASASATDSASSAAIDSSSAVTASSSADDSASTGNNYAAAPPPSSDSSSSATDAPLSSDAAPTDGSDSSSAAPSPSDAPTSSSDSAPAPSGDAGGGGGGGGGGADPRGNGPWTGTATFYAAGTNNCGGHDSPSDKIVAVHKSLYDRWPGYDAQHDLSPVCGRQVSINWRGKNVVATVTDSCPTCGSENDLDLSEGAFNPFFDEDAEAANKAGILSDMTWNWV